MLDNALGWKGAKALGEALQGQGTLRCLNLAHTALGDKGAAYLAEGLKLNATLCELILDGACLYSLLL